ncbi:MAG: hypothetical protein N3E45_01445 [Oscillatoriaceae bacterium SKW80]|nr:hypothetical protein [Oscillatoriaceae bacterium SKYG93]MCX8119493.1 hypothetical protein [Oscillatoriaceae bacterium SKW80]MDW8454960.1 hypothetical protein [Oscillatoriaceae cyanobacterium SKYGB_i_bin93]
MTATLAAPSSIQANQPQSDTTEQANRILPFRFVGIWKGEGNQTGLSDGWSISIALKPGKIGETIGTIAYPSLGCGGELTLHSVNTNSIELNEVITYGKECAQSGIVTLKQIANQTVEYKWSSPNYPGITASGVVTKINTEGQAVPTEYIGIWEGMGTHSNAAGEKNPTLVLLTLANSSPGSVIGTIVYPLSGCGGDLILQEVKADSINLSEEITYGKNCQHKGIVKLKQGENNNIIEYEWRSLLDSSIITGTLMNVK